MHKKLFRSCFNTFSRLHIYVIKNKFIISVLPHIEHWRIFVKKNSYSPEKFDNFRNTLVENID